MEMSVYNSSLERLGRSNSWITNDSKKQVQVTGYKLSLQNALDYKQTPANGACFFILASFAEVSVMSERKSSNEATIKGQKPKLSPSGIKSRSRVKERGEVFTEPREVKAMCDLCEPDISRIDKKVLEPGCGTGNFLTEILARRLKKAKTNQYDILIALSNIYGIDIAPDNVAETRTRLRNQIFDHLKDERSDKDFLFAVDLVLKHNIVVGDLLEGRKDIFLINWTPTSNGGFELEKWQFSDIERTRSKVISADNFASLGNSVTRLLDDRPPDEPNNPKPKQKPNSLEDLPMFSKRIKK